MSLLLCEPILLNEVAVGYVLEVEAVPFAVRAVVHPLTLTEPARQALGLRDDAAVQVVARCASGARVAVATWLLRGEDVVASLWAAGLSYEQARALGAALGTLLDWSWE